MADTGPIAVNYDDVDDLLPTAPQIVATRILVPCIVGWGLQLFLSGIAAMRALPHMRRRQAIPGARVLLIVATLANLVLAACVYWEIAAYMIDQARSTVDLNAYKLADVLNPIPACISATATQMFMTIRCWRIANRNLWILAVMTLLMIAVFAACIWGIAFNYLYSLDNLAAVDMFAPTQWWLWGSTAVDVGITFILVWHLARFRKYTSRRAEPYVDSLIRLSFETLAVPTFLNATAAIMYICTWQSAYWWNLMTAPLPMIPSCYVLSFVYCLEGSQATVQSKVIRITMTTAPPASMTSDKSSLHDEAYRVDVLRRSDTVDHAASEANLPARSVRTASDAGTERGQPHGDRTHITLPTSKEAN